MKKISALVFIAAMVMSVFAVGHIVYKNFFAPVKRVVTMYTVKTGDTWYGICDKHYMEENTECFDEFWCKVMQDNGSRKLFPGDEVVIINTVYK